MYKCDVCGNPTEMKQSMLKVSYTEPYTYRNEYGEVEGHGTRIVKEKKCCPDCYNTFEDKTISITNK